jgi:hypothetical protein
MTSLRLRVGAVLDLAEADYLYGLGQLALKVEMIGASVDAFPQLEWVTLVGRELYRDGAEGQRREVTVRVAAIKTALRSDDWRPPR